MHMPQDAQRWKGSRAEAFLMHRHRMLSAGATIGGIIIVCFSILYFLQTLRSDRHQPPLAIAGPLKTASGGGYQCQTFRTMPKRCITYQSGVYLGFDLVGIDSDGSAHQLPL
jgi:hypothetical protein